MKLYLIIFWSLFLSPFLILVYYLIVYLFAKVPIVITPKKYYNELFKKVSINKNSNIYELGCGKADFLFYAEKFSPNKITGYELSPLHVLYSKIKSKILKSKVVVHQEDFFNANIHDADIVYLFLVSKIIDKAWQKIIRETKKGTTVIVLSDRVTNATPVKSFLSNPNNKNGSKYSIYEV